MPDGVDRGCSLRFGVFEVDLDSGHLRRHGLRIRLPDQAFQVLVLLLERPGRVVTREDLRSRLWAADTFVDFESGLNKTVNRLRDALGDTAANPRFIETLPKRGYRFIAQVADRRCFASGDPVLAAPFSSSIPEIDSRPAKLANRERITWAAALFLVALSVGVVLYFRASSPPQQLVRSSLLPPPNTSFVPFNFALSPDGTRLAFVGESPDGKDKLWVRDLSSSGAQKLNGTDAASFPFWSPDSRHVGFFADRRLKTIDIAGGVPQILCEVGPITRGGAWNLDGVIIFARDIAGAIYRIQSTGGTPTPVTRVSNTGSSQGHVWPSFLPDGRHFVYFVQKSASEDAQQNGIYEGSLGSDSPVLISRELVGNVAFTSGYLMFMDNNVLTAQAFSPTSMLVKGRRIPVTSDELETEPAFFQAGFSASQTGVLVFQSSMEFASNADWFDSLGKRLDQIPEVGYQSLRLSPDGHQVATSCEALHNGRRYICVYDLARGIQTRITSGGHERGPIWSRDGKQIGYTSSEGNTYSMYRIAADGSGSAEVITKTPGVVNDWSPDGHLLFMRLGPTRIDLAIYSPSDGRVTTLGPGFEAQFSPDGHWIVHSTPLGILVRPYPGSGERVQIAPAGATQPRWSRDGKQVVYLAPDKKLVAVSYDAKRGTVSAPRVLFQTRIVSRIGGEYDVAPDGRFLINSLPSNAPPLTLITGWTTLLKD